MSNENVHHSITKAYCVSNQQPETDWFDLNDQFTYEDRKKTSQITFEKPQLVCFFFVSLS